MNAPFSLLHPLDDASQDVVVPLDIHALLEDAPMHVQLGNEVLGGLEWHRVAAGEFRETACGRVYDVRFDQLGIRRETYRGDLCAICFTTRELAKAADADAKAIADDETERAATQAKWDAWSSQRRAATDARTTLLGVAPIPKTPDDKDPTK